MDFLWNGLLSITWQQVVMYVVGLLLIYLAIEKNYEPALLLPMGFGAILVNLPASGVLNQFMEGAGETHGIIQWLFESGIEASEAFPLLLFIGIGAMIDFGPVSYTHLRAHETDSYLVCRLLLEKKKHIKKKKYIECNLKSITRRHTPSQ